MFDRVPITDRCLGKWRGILSGLGVESRYLTGKHGPCFMCVGKDRFRWSNHKDAGGYFCAKCGAGSGVDFVMNYFSLDFKAALQRIETVIGTAREDWKPTVSQEKQREAMRTVWNMGQAIKPSDPVGQYLTNRNISLEHYPKALRYIPSLRHQEGFSPAMVAQVIGTDGKAANVHRTWLTEDGHKAAITPCRKMMPGEIPSGSAIRLFPEAEVMGIAEGIETALRCHNRFDVPTWSTISAGGMVKFRPPAIVRELWIFGDSDLSWVGQAAAFSAARDILTWCQKDDRKISIRVEIPQKIGTDWADDV